MENEPVGTIETTEETIARFTAENAELKRENKIKDEKIKMLEEANDLLIQQEEDANEKSHTDRLTGLGNRAALDKYKDLIFHRKREGAPERRKEGQEDNVCAIMIDIDYFKKVNDTYGHIAGDKILKEVSNRLDNSIRSSDVIIRYGGEEILIMLIEASEYEASKKAERLRKAIESEKFDIDGAQIPVTISVGVAFGDKNSDPDKLIKNADKAMYESKNTGRNRVTIHKSLEEIK